MTRHFIGMEVSLFTHDWSIQFTDRHQKRWVLGHLGRKQRTRKNIDPRLKWKVKRSDNSESVTNEVWSVRKDFSRFQSVTVESSSKSRLSERVQRMSGHVTHPDQVCEWLRGFREARGLSRLLPGGRWAIWTVSGVRELRGVPHCHFHLKQNVKEGRTATVGFSWQYIYISLMEINLF